MNGWLAGAATLLLLRAALAFSPFTPMMGFNEAYYTLSAQNYDWSTFTPIVCLHDACRPHLKLPPLESTLIAGLFWFTPDDETVARIPSLAAMAGSVWVAWRLRSPFHAFLLASTPWFFLWMGRAQTDPILTFALFLTVYGLERGEDWAWLTGILIGVLAKQTYLLAAPLFLRRSWWKLEPGYGWRPAYALAATFPAVAWWSLQAKAYPEIFLEDLLFHARGRQAALGEAWPEVVALGVVLGSPAVWLLRRGGDWRLWAATGLFLGFAVLNAPYSHSYYALPATSLLVLLVPHKDGLNPVLTRGIVASGVVLSVMLAGFGGEADKPILPAALREMPPGTFIQSSLWPQAEYYKADFRLDGDACPAAPNRTILCAQESEGCETIMKWEGFFDRLLLQWCKPLEGLKT